MDYILWIVWKLYLANGKPDSYPLIAKNLPFEKPWKSTSVFFQKRSFYLKSTETSLISLSIVQSGNGLQRKVFV